MCATAGGGAARPRWCRPRPRRRRCPAPTADTVRTPGTFGISAWLLRSEAKRHLRCRRERTGRDQRRDRRRSYASPYPWRLVAAGEGLGSCYSSATPPFLLVGPRRDSGVVAPWLPRISRGWAPAITANAHLYPQLPVLAEYLLAATGSCASVMASCWSPTGRSPRPRSKSADTALRRVAEDPADAPHR